MKTKNIDDYYTEELERHNFQILDHGGPGKCSKHAHVLPSVKVIRDIENDVQGMMIGGGNLSDGEMTSLQENQSFSLLTTESLTKEDMYKLYIVKRFDTVDNYNLTPDTDIEGLLDRNSIQT